MRVMQPSQGLTHTVLVESELSQSVTVCVVAPTRFRRFDDGVLMGDVLLSAFHAAFGFLEPPLQVRAVHTSP
jgi:hypothetical protein